jgi:WD40 repeat protein
LEGHNARLNAVRFSPDGRRLATGADDHTARIWDAESGKQLATLSEHSMRVWTVAFSPDGRRLATGSQDSTARLWDMDTGKQLFTLAGHTGTVMALAFSPDGKQLATVGDSTVRLWDTSDGRELITLYTQSALRSMTFSPDGSVLATLDADGRVQAYTLQIDQLMQLAKERITRSLTTAECRKYLHLDECPTAP